MHGVISILTAQPYEKGGICGGKVVGEARTLKTGVGAHFHRAFDSEVWEGSVS
jgi:hypothetical protein